MFLKKWVSAFINLFKRKKPKPIEIIVNPPSPPLLTVTTIFGLPTHKTRKWKQRKRTEINEIIVHHSAIVCGRGRGINHIKNIAKYHITPGNHISKNGCPGICYHWVIDRNGFIYKTSSHTNITWHCKRHNYKSIGICLLGFFSVGKQRPSEEQINSLHQLLSYLINDFGLEKKDVYCHRDFKSTLCPGDIVYKFVKDFKEGA